MTKTMTINGMPVVFQGSKGRIAARADFTDRIEAAGFADGLAGKGLYPRMLENDGGWMVVLNMAAADVLKLAR